MITLIEEMSLNAVPSLETLFYDGWIIRLSKGYTSIEPTSVRVLDIRNIPSPTINSIKISSSLEDGWLMDYCKFNNISPQHMQIVKTTLASIIPEKYFVTLMDKDMPVACGLGVLEINLASKKNTGIGTG